MTIDNIIAGLVISITSLGIGLIWGYIIRGRYSKDDNKQSVNHDGFGW